MPEPIRDPAVEGFLALLATQRAERTVDAYRRDLAALAAHLGRSPDTATRDELQGWLASQRADGLSASTIARRTAAARSFFRHQLLLGMRDDNPAAALDLPRRTRKLPRTLSPGEAERLIDAADGTRPRDLRDKALVELLYGAGLRVSEAVGLDRTGVDLDARIVRTIGKGGKERIVPVGRAAVDALRRYLSRGRPFLDARHRPELFLNARGGALTRAGAFLILRRACREGRPRAGPRAPAPPPPLVRHAPARGRRRPAQRAGDAGACGSVDDRALHPRHRPKAPGGVLPGTPARTEAPSRIGRAVDHVRRRRPRLSPPRAATEPRRHACAAARRPLRPPPSARAPAPRPRRASAAAGSCPASASRS